MKQTIRLILIIFLSIQALQIFAASRATDTLANKLHHFKTLAAEFEQVVEDQNGKEIQRSQGRVSIQKPGLFRWEIKKPFQQLLIAKDGALWVYDKALDQATHNPVDAAIGKTPALLLTDNSNDLLKDFNIKRESPSANLDWFAITPKSSPAHESAFERVLLGFDGNSLKKMIIADNLGQHSYIIFRNVRLNTSLPEDLFLFTPPPGVDVIDNIHDH